MTTGFRFGTDGLRGRVGSEIDEDLLWRLGVAAATRLGSPEIVVGRDTRESGPSLSAALVDGFVAGGARVCDLGVAPTPAVARVAASRGVAGAIVTASHNPYHDNGVKLLARGGTKLDDSTEDAISYAVGSVSGSRRRSVVEGCAPWREAYLDHVLSGTPRDSLRGFSVVLDCANGAFAGLAGEAIAALGADVVEICAEPDGRNINDGCGATAPGSLSSSVRLHGADLGFAFDGDGDRVVAVDHLGEVVDGDRLIALAAIDLDERNQLPGRGVVVTVMTNSGFHTAMHERGIEVVTTPVGDRSVLEGLERNGFVLGGEQSGHIVFRDRVTTGDGLLAAVTLLDVLRRSGRRLHDVAAGVMHALPQVVRSVEVARTDGVESALAADVSAATAELRGVGRILLRASGTEPKVRVMVEAADDETAVRLADRLASVARDRLGEPR